MTADRALRLRVPADEFGVELSLVVQDPGAGPAFVTGGYRSPSGYLSESWWDYHRARAAAALETAGALDALEVLRRAPALLSNPGELMRDDVLLLVIRPGPLPPTQDASGAYFVPKRFESHASETVGELRVTVTVECGHDDESVVAMYCGELLDEGLADYHRARALFERHARGVLLRGCEASRVRATRRTFSRVVASGAVLFTFGPRLPGASVEAELHVTLCLR